MENSLLNQVKGRESYPKVTLDTISLFKISFQKKKNEYGFHAIRLKSCLKNTKIYHTNQISYKTTGFFSKKSHLAHLSSKYCHIFAKESIVINTTATRGV